MTEPLIIHTIGHSSRSIEEFIELLRESGIDCLVDVRTAPYSRYRPEFSKRQLEAAMTAAGIRYVFLGDSLGGRPEWPECYVGGKVDYDQIRKRPEYQGGIERLRKAREQGMRLALMCSEGKPEECHRSKLIGVTLAEMGIPVSHIDEEGAQRTQEEIIARVTGGQPGLFGDASFTSRKRYGEESKS
jgi:uncharacterized protein (DUF488 family)